ncbi:hypothetical protein EON65_17885 [archaeon]|nr:MAG: hypothetical protein EON65_17885 [archaeon]
MEGKKDAIRSRQPFTPGWTDAWEGEEGLPIKRGNKVIRVRKEKTSNKEAGVEEEPVTIIDDEGDEEAKVTGQEKVKQEVKPRVKIALTSKVHSVQEIREIQQNIADICTSITANPEAALLRKDSSIDRGMKDLFQLLEGTADAQELEWAMLSATLVFKDICPSYRIRTDDDEPMESGKQLKKDTKKLRDFELNLLKAYRRFLRLLDQKATEGLGASKKAVEHWGLEQRVGMVAVRCQCELIKVLNQFNFRSDLLNSVVNRASQPQPEVSDLCCDTLNHILLHDVHCDLSFEIVTALSKILTATKYIIPERLLRCLQFIKLTVHADKVKSLQQQVKSQRKKRRRTHDSVEAMMLEASQEADKLARQRFQGNSLQEIALIYFRYVVQTI